MHGGRLAKHLINTTVCTSGAWGRRTGRHGERI